LNEESRTRQASVDACAEQEERRLRAERVERLFREHNEALIRFLQARLRSPQEAHEVAQEAYVRLLSLDETGAVSYLRAFLFKTAANLAVDRLRREELHARATALPLFHEFADVRTPERRAAAAQSLERLERLVAALPVKCRRVFVLHRFHGRDVDSIAQEMGLSHRMVQTYLVRALLYCQKGLDLEHVERKESSHD
jgi:RNA polymerase sigma-70 factor (ECF subfamily)